MEIRTKFNVGDKVYHIYQLLRTGTWYWLEDIISEIDYKTDLGIRYWSDNRVWKEQNCFATKEEAQKECERRNGKE